MSDLKMPPVSGTALELAKNQAKLLHAMQTGVRYEIEKTLPNLPPDVQQHLKHLRVGINSAMCEVSAMLWVLVDKGLVTHEEYFLRLNRLLQQEVEMYEAKLTKLYGAKVTLE